MPRKDPRVTAYVAAAAPFARPILREIRAAVHEGCPDAQETLKWGMPAFVRRGILGGMAAFKSHAALWLWRGRHLRTLGPGKPGAMGQFGRLTGVADLPGRAALVRLFREAAALDERLATRPAARRGAGPGRFPRVEPRARRARSRPAARRA